MVKMEDAVIARFDHAGLRFEVLVDPILAAEVKKGNAVNYNDLLAIDTIFKDAHKGEEASPVTVQKVFGTIDVATVAQKIIRDGHVQLTTEQRRQMVEQRRKEIVSFIAMNAINPQTNSPHPPARIENALEEIKFNVDVFKSAQEQVPDILKELRKLLPISMEKIRVAVRIPAAYSAKANALLHKYELKQEEWQKDGSLIAVVELPAGLKQELFNELNHLTHGEIELKILEKN